MFYMIQELLVNMCINLPCYRVIIELFLVASGSEFVSHKPDKWYPKSKFDV